MGCEIMIRQIGLALVSMLLLVGAPVSATPVFVGYFPAFKGLEARLASTPIDGYSHINIAFANPDHDGAVARDGRMTCMASGNAANASVAELRAAAQHLRSKGARVLLSVAGGIIPECSGDWRALLAPDRRDALVRELLAVVEDAGLDGLDVDIEGALLTDIDRDGNYTPFIAALSKALRPAGKLLTVATASYEGGMIPVSSIPFFDLVMPMSYDAIGSSWGEPGAEHSTLDQARRDIDLWLARGVPRERLVLGVPFYGYGFGTYAPNYDYRTLAADYPEDALRTDVIGEACAGCDYITFNSRATIRAKAELAARRAGGIMVWEMTQDTDDRQLGRTIAAALGLAATN